MSFGFKGTKAWPVTDCSGDKGLTVQSDRQDADINVVVGRFVKTGQVPVLRGGQPFYGDVSIFGDLQSSMLKIQEADELFMAYPAEIRERFDNDKVKLVEFLADEANYEEALKLGLVQKRPEVEAPPAPPAP